MSSLQKRLARNLTEAAESISPSPGAWEAIRTRVAEQADSPLDTEVILMLEQDRSNEETRPIQGGGRDRWKLLVAALIALAVGVGGVVALVDRESNTSPLATDSDGTEGATTTTQPPTTTTDVNHPAAVAQALQTLEAEYEVYNSGDVEARRGAGGLADHDYYWAFAAADHRIDEIDCESRGFGDWTGDGGEISQVEDGAEGVTGYGFTCQGSGSNLFHDAASLDTAITLQWVVADGQAVLMADAGNENEWFAFYEDFLRWMRVTHPAVFDGMEFRRTAPTSFPTAESMPTALEYVDAFVEASPDWPRPSGS